MSVLVWRLLRRAAPAALLAGLASVAAAQNRAQESLKPGRPEARTRPICPVTPPRNAPSEEATRRARLLAQRGQQAAILGDAQSALDALLEATSVDPTDPDLAYQLGRVHELMLDSVSAVREYCRFLSLAPTAPEASEVVEKVLNLTPPRIERVIDLPLAVYQRGLAAYQRGRLAAADSAFSTVIRLDSTWADAYYNRGRVRIALGDVARGQADLARFRQLSPESRVYSPGRALLFGTLIPGGGEFYTRRPIRGVLTVAAVAGAITAGALMNNGETGSTTVGFRKRPYLIWGLATAGTISAVSALDAALFAYLSRVSALRR